MNRKDWTLPAVILETVTVLCVFIYTGLQIFYGISYGISPFKFLANVLTALLIYAVLLMLQINPEYINHLPKEACTGKVRSCSLWMVRLVKLFFLGSLMIPCVADALGIQIRSAWSAIVILLIIGTVVCCECRILSELKNRNGGNE